jgi:hypothetical protein
MILGLQDLKVDQTVLQSHDNSGILVTNINIPSGELENIHHILHRVRQLIVSDYNNINNIQYQVCATYELRNTLTGDTRQWTGSFNPRGNEFNTLAGFRIFDHTFEATVIQASSTDNVLRRLRFYHIQTNWVFHRLTSIIISVQSVINLTHPTLLRRGLLARRHGRTSRSISTFLLP